MKNEILLEALEHSSFHLQIAIVSSVPRERVATVAPAQVSFIEGR